MDAHFNNILNVFKRLDESQNTVNEKSTSEKQARTMAAAAHDPAFAKKVGIKQSVAKEFNKADKGTAQLSRAMKHKNEEVEEGSMANAEHHPDGPQFGGYWKGTDKGTPAPGEGVGGCAESIEQRLRNKYNQYIKETGIISATGMTTNNAQDPAKALQQMNGVKKELDNAKTKKLIPPNTNTQQAAQGLDALQQAGGDMNKVPSNLKQKIAPVINGIAGALGAGAKNPQQTNKVTQGLGMLGGAAATLE
jgi:hypothetical protein